MNVHFSSRNQELLKKGLRLMLVSGFFGVWVGVLNAFLNEDAIFWNALTGALTGMVTSISISTAETYLFARYLRRARFFVGVLVRTIYYATMVTFWLTMSYGFEKLLSKGRFDIEINRSFYVAALLILLLTFLLNVYVMLSRLVGRQVLGYFLTGKYHRPVEEERIFMFLDIRGSTEIAEKLGDLRYQDFLNDFFYDITNSILRTKGEIYKYVGDAVIVSWPIKLGVKNGNCLRCYQSIQDTLTHVRNRYRHKYGFAPEFRVGLHGGPVVAAEIGDNKREIAFLGDTVNTAARLQEECKQQEVECLISGDLLHLIRAQGDTHFFKSERIGAVRLRGKEQGTELIRIWFS
ncbi:adenylate/guanylate cyclase domain-containing protein [Tumebacillus sp. ITR2]|uniref:Adenylate/guanylate cyclase domain-containing protein n=1 Tax=Tumebacillus amylolyticus TaxID=2801339 RepID=A0ABS1JG46_9BACL|nr:adenylate/guanylate cyclase domain-containing protein [Tumebacillus amylolyticus]MBL0389217.1 adenylate/guanylate cyclase domain-containing protein [Tumebacillus amylolyticus]